MKQIVTSVLMTLLCHMAFSQTMDQDTFLIKEIEIDADVVFTKKQTALKTVVPLKHIPIATSSVNRQMIDIRGVNNINDAVRYTTGVRSSINYGGFQTFNFRGFGRPVIMVDGMRDERMNWSNSAPVTSLTAVESIEYLKGPASVMYGHSAVGGILNIVRKQPTAVANYNARLSYGTWNNRQMQVGAGGALSSKLNYRFDAGYTDSEGWRDNNTKIANVYLALDFHLSDADVIKLKLGANDDLYGTETGLPALSQDVFETNTDKHVYSIGDLPAGFKREQRYNDPADFLKHKNSNISASWEHSLSSKSKLINSISYNDDDIDYFSTESLSYLTSDNAIYKHYYMSGDSKKYISIDSLQRTFPLRFSHKTKTYQYNADYYTQFNTGSVKHSLVAGYSFLYVDRISYKGYNLPSLSDVENNPDLIYDSSYDVYGQGLYAKIAVSDPILNHGYLKTQFSGAAVMDDQSHGLYFQDIMDITEKLKLMIAGRFDYYQYARRDASITSGLDYDFDPKKPEKSITNKAFSYRSGIVYLPNEDLSLYASVSSFFRPLRTTYNESYIYLDANGKQFYPEDGEELYEPEKGYQAEAGFKWELGHTLSLNGSAYYIVKENIVEYLGRTNDENQNRIYGQVGKVDSKGFELDAMARPAVGLFINAGYSLNKAKYKEFADNPYSNGSGKEGNTLQNAPENQLFAWINYTIQSGLFKKLSLGAGARYTDDIFTNSSNTYVLPSYTVCDATMAYTFDKVTLRLNANNIANEEYYDNSVFSNQYVPGMGRSYEASISLNF
ncbi:MAG: TonB-dependent receptor [Bacteroidales bacterium]|nr:TonB-dependent receptor [Bacteroidales bacterium]